MKYVHIFGGLLLLVTCLGLVRDSWSQKPAPILPDREGERRSFVINLARALNSAEADYKSKHGAYANWDTLLGMGYFTDTGTKWASSEFPTVAHALYSRGPEIVPGWKLRLRLSNNGNSYDLVLEDVTDPKCGYAAFSDERGLIRQGKFVDCPL
jgi:hypothetical protein